MPARSPVDALSGDDPPTAFLCLADSIAYGVYAAADELGLQVPEDVSVLGFDDNQVSRLLTPPLSTYRWPVTELVGLVVERTVRAIDNDKRSKRKVLTADAADAWLGRAAALATGPAGGRRIAALAPDVQRVRTQPSSRDDTSAMTAPINGESVIPARPPTQPVSGV